MFSNILVFLDKLQGYNQFPSIISLAKNTNASVILLGYTRLRANLNDPIEWNLGHMEAEIELDRVVEALRDEHITASRILLDSPEDGTLAQSLAQQVSKAKADLLILGGSHRHLLLDPVLIGTGISILVSETTHQEFARQIKKVMIPLDCSLRAECVLPIARQFSQAMNASLLLTHVVDCIDMPPRLQHDPQIADLLQQVVAYKYSEGQRYLNQVQSSMPADSDIRLVVNKNIRQALYEIAQRDMVDMVILSAHGLSGNTDWPYGSVAQSFITQGRALPLFIVQDAAADKLHSDVWAHGVPVATRPKYVA